MQQPVLVLETRLVTTRSTSATDPCFLAELNMNTLNMYLDFAQQGLEKAIDKELPTEHIEYIEKTALRNAVVAVIARHKYVVKTVVNPSHYVTNALYEPFLNFQGISALVEATSAR